MYNNFPTELNTQNETGIFSIEQHSEIVLAVNSFHKPAAIVNADCQNIRSINNLDPGEEKDHFLGTFGDSSLSTRYSSFFIILV